MLTASRALRLLPTMLQGGDIPLSSAVQFLTFKHGPFQQSNWSNRTIQAKAMHCDVTSYKIKKGRPTDLNLKCKTKQTNKQKENLLDYTLRKSLGPVLTANSSI